MGKRRGRPKKVTEEVVAPLPDDIDLVFGDSGEPPLPQNVLERRPTPERPKNQRSRAMCPRCHGMNTLATSTQKVGVSTIQHRICRNPVCRNRYKRMLNR